jgi:hypothetical protein
MRKLLDSDVFFFETAMHHRVFGCRVLELETIVDFFMASTRFCSVASSTLVRLACSEHRNCL